MRFGVGDAAAAIENIPVIPQQVMTRKMKRITRMRMGKAVVGGSLGMRMKRMSLCLRILRKRWKWKMKKKTNMKAVLSTTLILMRAMECEGSVGVERVCGDAGLVCLASTSRRPRYAMPPGTYFVLTCKRHAL